MVPPMATTVACVEPETAPKKVHAAVVVTARPPRVWPKKAMTKSMSRRATCPVEMTSAAKMNIGTATRESGRTPTSICWTRFIGSSAG